VSDRLRLGLTILAPLAVLVLLGSWLASRFEPWPVTVHTWPSREAQEDPFLAARRLLTELGADVEDVRDFRDRELPSTDVTIFIAGPHYSLGKRQIQEIVAWVKSGGHLAVAVNVREKPPAFLADDDEETDTSDQEDPLLEAFGVHTMPATFGESIVVNGSGLRQSEEIIELDPKPTGGLRVNDYEATPAELWIGDDDNTAAVRLQIDEGTVSAWTSESWATNALLNKGDNALVLWELARRRLNPEVWLVPRLEPPHLGLLVWRHGWPAILALAALLVAALAGAAQRLGPLAPAPPPVRRSLEEHLLASGRLLDSAGAADALVTACRRAVEARAKRRAPSWERMSRQERLAFLASLSGQSARDVAAAFEAGDGGSSLATKVRQLESLRRSL
jgi:hypothetical protein